MLNIKVPNKIFWCLWQYQPFDACDSITQTWYGRYSKDYNHKNSIHVQNHPWCSSIWLAASNFIEKSSDWTTNLCCNTCCMPQAAVFFLFALHLSIKNHVTNVDYVKKMNVCNFWFFNSCSFISSINNWTFFLAQRIYVILEGSEISPSPSFTSWNLGEISPPNRGKFSNTTLGKKL